MVSLNENIAEYFTVHNSTIALNALGDEVGSLSLLKTVLISKKFATISKKHCIEVTMNPGSFEISFYGGVMILQTAEAVCAILKILHNSTNSITILYESQLRPHAFGSMFPRTKFFLGINCWDVEMSRFLPLVEVLKNNLNRINCEWGLLPYLKGAEIDFVDVEGKRSCELGQVYWVPLLQIKATEISISRGGALEDFYRATSLPVQSSLERLTCDSAFGQCLTLPDDLYADVFTNIQQALPKLTKISCFSRQCLKPVLEIIECACKNTILIDQHSHVDVELYLSALSSEELDTKVFQRTLQKYFDGRQTLLHYEQRTAFDYWFVWNFKLNRVKLEIKICFQL